MAKKSTKQLNEHVIFVTGGCSFTAPHTDNKTWSTFLGERLNGHQNRLVLKVEDELYKYNLTTVAQGGKVSAGNDYIINNAVANSEWFRNTNTEYPEDLSPIPEKKQYCHIIQLTSLNRRDVWDQSINRWHFAPKPTRMLVDDVWEPLAELGDKLYRHLTFSHFRSDDKNLEEGAYIRDIQPREYWKKYYQYHYTEELHFSNLIHNVLTAQTYFERRGMKHRFFLGWDIFTDKETPDVSSTDNSDGSHDVAVDMTMWSSDQLYKNKKYGLLIDKYPRLKPYWELIDWSKFWFFENNDVQYGGMNEWVKYNLAPEDWYVSKGDPHPSNKAQKKFHDQIITELIAEMLHEGNKK